MPNYPETLIKPALQHQMDFRGPLYWWSTTVRLANSCLYAEASTITDDQVWTTACALM